VSEDFGKTWTSIRANLPWGSTRCLRESPFNENVLFVGTEFAAFVSVNRGGLWNSLNSNLPTVAVHEFAFHPNNGEVVVATHGRSLWIADISALHQFAETQLENPTLYKPNTVIRWRREPSRGGTNRAFVGENPPSGASIYYSLPKRSREVSIKVSNALGQTVREIRGPGEAGLHRVGWDLTIVPPRERGAGGPGGGQRGGGAAALGRTAVATSGTYKVTLTVDGQEFAQELRLVNDPNYTSMSELVASEDVEYELWMGDVEADDVEEDEESDIDSASLINID
jgi:hypothetical protein